MNPAWIPPGALLLVLPFAHTSALRLTLLIITLAIAAEGSRRAHPPTIPCKWPLLAWAAFGFASLAWSSDAAYSWNELRNEVCYPILVFLGFFALTDRWRVLQWWGRLIIAGGIVVSIYALLAYSQGAEWAPSWTGDANAYSTYVVLLTPMLLVAGTRYGGGIVPGWMVGASLVLALICGHLTLNRMIWPTLALMLLVFLTLYMRKAQASARIRSLGMLAFVAACTAFAALYLVAYQLKGGSGPLATADIQFGLEQDPRPQIWKYAAARIAEKPLTGYGYGRGILMNDFRSHFGEPLYWHAHSLFLNAALEMGIGGVLALAWLYGSLAREFWRVYRSQPLPGALLGAFGLTLIVGALTKSLTDDVLVRENSLLLWSQLGMALGMAHRLARGGKPTTS
jgi:O-antigen ligase